MEVKKIEENKKEDWNIFIKNHKYGHFLQSWEWGDIMVADSEKIKRIAIFDRNKIIGLALAVRYQLPLNKSYLYVPRGPVLNWGEIHKQGKINKEQEALIMILDEVRKFGQRESALFLRLDPEMEATYANSEFWQQIGFTKSPKEVQPERTISLDLALPEDQLLKFMKSKTRYNIRLAGRKGVKVKVSTEVSDINFFYNLVLETARRDKFYPHPQKHYEDIIKIMGSRNLAKIFLAEYKNKIIAANIVSFFGQKAIYMHGASSNKHRNLMSTYLLQWKAILEAKSAGCQLYDFGGVIPETETRHSWAGISKFKRGFGGQEIEYIGAWDLPYISSQYRLFSFTNTIRRRIKRI